jgi:integrase
MRTEHRVPMSSQTLDVVRSMQTFSADLEPVFQSPCYPDKPLNEENYRLLTAENVGTVGTNGRNPATMRHSGRYGNGDKAGTVRGQSGDTFI